MAHEGGNKDWATLPVLTCHANVHDFAILEGSGGAGACCKMRLPTAGPSTCRAATDRSLYMLWLLGPIGQFCNSPAGAAERSRIPSSRQVANLASMRRAFVSFTPRDSGYAPGRNCLLPVPGRQSGPIGQPDRLGRL